MPELVPVTLTPQETAEFEQLALAAAPAGPAPVNPIRDLSAQEIFDLATNDTSFDIAAEFTRNKDLWGDQAVVQKAADAFHMLRQRGFKFSDLPGPSKIVGAVADIGKGFIKQAANYASAALSPVVGAVGELTGQDASFHEAVGQDAQRKIAENIAGSEASVSGLADMAKRGIGKVARGAGLAKSLDEYTPEEKVKELFAATGPVEQQQEIAKGKGAFLTPVGGEVVKELEQADKGVRPEEVAELAPGDPLAWWTFGKALGGTGKLVPFKPQLAKAGEKIGEAATVAGGRVIQALGEATRVGSKVTGKIAPVVGAIKGGIEAGPLGVLAGTKVGEITKSITKRGVAAGESIASVGKEVAGASPAVRPIAQLGKDVIQSVPGAVGKTAEGLAMDIGFAAATSETPAETEAGVGIGAALGGLQGAAGAGRRILSGQLIAPRAWGSQVARPSSGQHPTLDAMHKVAYDSASPGQKERLNAIREFVKGAAPNTDVFLGSDPAAIERALVEAGVSPESAKASAQQEGFFTTSINNKPVIVLRDADTAPHEAFHAFQDVLGERGNLAVDQIIRDAYVDRWDAEGQRYADRLAGKSVENWRDTVLEGSGWGQLHAVEKLYMDVANRLRAEQGAEPRPADVEAIVRSEAQGKDWRSILTPEEQTAAADKYLARELAAENFDAAFKNLGGALKEQTGVIPKLARIIGNVVSAFGGEPLAGRESEFGKVPLRADAVEAVKGAVREKRPEVSVPPAPTPAKPSRGPVIPSSDPAEEARVIAESAPEVPVAGGTRSPKELLGEVALAIASRKGVKINYLSAPGEPAASISQNREARREVIEAFRTMPASARALWEKNFFPDRVIKLKGDKYQVLGWAPEVFAANAHKMAKALKGNEVLSPYEISGDSFSEKGWRDLFADVETFSRNQIAGQTGAGEPLVVPKNIKDAGFFAPASKGSEVAPLDQRKADFINVLFGYKLPETPRIQKGKLPLNIVGQDVSTATKPGRIRVPVEPKGKFTGPEAERQNIEGREILEVNPLRNELQAALGDKYPSLIEAQQRLNLESIKEVQVAPEQPEFRANTLTLTAGFQPRRKKPKDPKKEYIKTAAVKLMGSDRIFEGTFHEDAVDAADQALREEGQGLSDYEPRYHKGYVTSKGRFVNRVEAFRLADDAGQLDLNEISDKGKSGALHSGDFFAARQFQPRTASGKKLADEGYEYKVEGGVGNRRISLDKDGQEVAFIEAIGDQKDPLKAHIDMVWVNPELRGRGIGEALNREAGAILKEDGFSDVEATVVNPAEAKIIGKVFPDTSFEPVKNREGEVIPAVKSKSKITPASQFQPERIKTMTPEEWTKEVQEFKGTLGGGPTGYAFDMGSKIKTADELAALRSTVESLRDMVDSARAAKDFDTWGKMATRMQIAHEAYQAATGEKLDGTPASVDFIRKNYKPDYQPPMPGESFKRSEKKLDISAPSDKVEGVMSNQAQPKRAKDKYKFPKTSTGGIRKAWVMPNGDVEQLGGTWHHEWLAENPDVAKKYGLTIPKFEGTDSENVREEAMKKGFIRVNNTSRDGNLIIEGRARDWRKVKTAMENLVERNIDDIDNVTVHLFDDKISKVVDSETRRLFVHDNDADKLANLPFSEREPRGIGAVSQFQAPRAQFSDDSFENQLKQVRAGQLTGQTFNPDGSVWKSETPSDIVTLASVNIPQGDLSRDTFENAVAPYKELLNKPGIVAGVFSFSKEGEPTTSIDINAVVPQEHRDNSIKFAKDNDQVAIFDAEKFEDVRTGGKGNTRLRDVDDLLIAAESLVAGEPVDMDAFTNRTPESDLFGAREVVSARGMSQTELKRNFPEAVITKEPVPSDIVGSPLYKRAGGEAKAVVAFANKLVEFAKENMDRPEFKAGKKWYSEFAPRLKKEFGKDAPIMAELLAATSPQTNVETNFAYALDAMESLKSGRFDKIIDKFNQGLEMIDNGKWEAWYKRNLKNIPNPPAEPTPAAFLAHWIETNKLKPRQSNGKLYGQHSLSVLRVFARRWLSDARGPKTLNFVENLLGSGHEATIDLWADRTMRRLGYAGFADRWRILPQNIAPVADADFAFAQKAFRRAAEQLKMNPDDLQGALWFAEKQLWADKGWSRLDLGDFRKELDKAPLLRQGIKHRLDKTKAQGKIKPAQELELLVEPR